MRLILTLLIVGMLAGCHTAADPNKVQDRNIGEFEMIDYKNGVFYFPLLGAEFGNALSAFLEGNDCRIEGMVGNREENKRSIEGYFVVCR